MTSSTFDVIIVGGGIMGSCTAYQTSKRGYSTLLLDQFDMLHNRGSSYGESRTLRLTYSKPYYSSMALESTTLWEEAQSQIGYKVVYPTNQLDMGPANNSSVQASIRSCQCNSIEYRVLDPDQLAQEFSGGVTVPADWIGVVSGGAGVIKPTKAVSMFQTLAFQNGAVLKDNVKVNNVTRDTNSNCMRIITNKGEIIYGKKCVVTVGAWMKELIKTIIGKEIPIKPLDISICYWKVKEEYVKCYSIDAGFPTFAGHGSQKIYGTPSLEYPGLIKVTVDDGPICDPNNRKWAPSVEIIELVKKFVKERFGGRVEHEGPVMTQSCMYSMTPDEDYVIDFLGGEFGKDLVIAGGFSGHGFKMGPVIGRIVADLALTGEVKGVELEHFKMDRFHQYV